MKITLFQIILILAILVIYLFVRKSSFRSFYRLFILFALTAGVVAVLVPELTTKVAQVVGIGRGTDLVVYIFMLMVFLKMLTTDEKVNAQQEQITQLVRKNAIENARKCDGVTIDE
jgi:hypothetical protein